MRNQPRAGFTLIELMVALALTMFIMVILSQAFMLSLTTFSGMKGIGDMQITLRTAEVILHDDLRQDHLEGKRRLSDLTLTPGVSQLMVQPPQAGFFAVRRSSQAPTAVSTVPPFPAYVLEGYDASLMPSRRATDHLLYMTVKRKGNRQENFFTASLQGAPAELNAFFAPPTSTAYNVDSAIGLPTATWSVPYSTGASQAVYSSQWAEVLYYLVRTGSTEEPNNPLSPIGTPTYALYRAQFVMVPDATAVNLKAIPNAALGTFIGMSCNPGAPALSFYSPADAAVPGQGKRVLPDLAAYVPPATFNPADRVCAASTLVLPNVISFEVQVMRLTDMNFDPNNTGPAGIYDTTKFGAAGYPSTGLKGIQITLRVWETNTRQTRQATIVQDL